MSEEQTGTPVQDPAPEAPQPVAAPPAPGPWSQDISFITDDGVRNQVDQYLREKWQPRMTQLEQTAAQATESQRLMNDLINSPNETMEALAAELNWTPQQLQQVVEEQVYEPTQETPTVDPRVQNMLEHFEQQQAQSAYDQEMNRAVERHPGLKPDLFHPFVSAADGDFDNAYQMYENWVGEWNTNAATPAEAAPPTLGGDAGSTTPPVQPKEQSLGDAIDDFLATNRSTNPPPIA